MSDPESLTPASRLIMDSIRSPNKDPVKFRTPKAEALITTESVSTLQHISTKETVKVRR